MKLNGATSLISQLYLLIALPSYCYRLENCSLHDFRSTSFTSGEMSIAVDGHRGIDFQAESVRGNSVTHVHLHHLNSSRLNARRS